MLVLHFTIILSRGDLVRRFTGFRSAFEMENGRLRRNDVLMKYGAQLTFLPDYCLLQPFYKFLYRLRNLGGSEQTI